MIRRAGCLWMFLVFFSGTLLAETAPFAFVIMSFSGEKQLEQAYQESIKPTVEKLGYKCIRVDEHEHNGSIVEVIFSHIQGCDFVVADLTEERPNCYYELGVAHQLGKQVILLSRLGTYVHTDVAGINRIVYENPKDLSKRLEKRIQGTVVQAKKDLRS